MAEIRAGEHLPGAGGHRKDPGLTKVSAELKLFAREQGYPVIDLFAPMDALDREKFWTDGYHFTDEAKAMQAEMIAAVIVE